MLWHLMFDMLFAKGRQSQSWYDLIDSFLDFDILMRIMNEVYSDFQSVHKATIHCKALLCNSFVSFEQDRYSVHAFSDLKRSVYMNDRYGRLLDERQTGSEHTGHGHVGKNLCHCCSSQPHIFDQSDMTGGYLEALR